MATDPFFQPAEAGRGDEGRAARRGELVLAALVAFLFALPFLDKAVQQDDWAYVVVSKFLIEEPATVLDRETVYQGEQHFARDGIFHGPVWLVLLGLAQQLVDGLLLGHLLQAAFLALTAAAIASLAARLGAPPVPTALALVLSPAPLVLSGALMTDLPMVALFSAALAVFVRGVATGSTKSLWLAGLLGLAAELTRYYGLAILPMFLVGPFLLGPFRRKNLLPFAVSLGGFLAYTVVTRVVFGQADSTRATGALAGIAQIDREGCLLATACTLGGSALVWLVGALLAPGRTLRGLLGEPVKLSLCLLGLALGVTFALTAAGARDPQPKGINIGVQWVCFLLGGVLLLAALRPWFDVARMRGGLASWRKGRGFEAWVGLWLAGFAFAAVVAVPFGSTRYCLPALPPLFLLAGLFAARHLPRAAAWIAVIVSAVLGVLCAEADRRAARVYPEYAEEIAAALGEGGELEGRKAWIWGELGFRYYLERTAGLEILPTSSNEPAAGDVILRSGICTASPDGRTGTYRLHKDLFPRIAPIPGAERVFEDDWPVRIHNPYAAAGFYGRPAGFLPFAFSTVPHDRMQLWRAEDVNPFFESFDAARKESFGPRHVAGGNIKIQRFPVAPTIEARNAISIMFPGRVTWPSVPVPESSRLSVFVGEHSRVWQTPDEEWLPARVRILVDGEVTAERELRARAEPADRTWTPLVVDLDAWGGRSVAITFEVEVLREPGDPVPELPAVLVGFGDPRLHRKGG